MNFISSIPPLFRRICQISLCALLLASYSAGIAGAQEPSTDAAPAPDRVTVQAPSKSYILEGIIFAALCGAALFAVCRSSPRGN